MFDFFNMYYHGLFMNFLTTKNARKKHEIINHGFSRKFKPRIFTDGHG